MRLQLVKLNAAGRCNVFKLAVEMAGYLLRFKLLRPNTLDMMPSQLNIASQNDKRTLLDLQQICEVLQRRASHAYACTCLDYLSVQNSPLDVLLRKCHISIMKRSPSCFSCAVHCCSQKLCVCR
mmetsp:Transcript_38623/g.81146  ORF Transcript_38623/g.81146 Transcript_38623/m.81146 type:complete len:124 (+) Transcript_38623:560-931(+)